MHVYLLCTKCGQTTSQEWIPVLLLWLRGGLGWGLHERIRCGDTADNTTLITAQFVDMTDRLTSDLWSHPRARCRSWPERACAAACECECRAVERATLDHYSHPPCCSVLACSTWTANDTCQTLSHSSGTCLQIDVNGLALGDGEVELGLIGPVLARFLGLLQLTQVLRVVCQGCIDIKCLVPLSKSEANEGAASLSVLEGQHKVSTAVFHWLHTAICGQALRKYIA